MGFKMQIYWEAGIFYDALQYLNAHFSGETCQFPTESVYAELTQALGEDPIPAVISPFFKSRHSLPAPILEYIRMKTAECCSSISELTQKLCEEEEREKLHMITTYTLFYPDISADEHGIHSDRAETSLGDCSVKTAMRLDKMDYPADFKYQALLCLTYFRHAVSELCRTLSRIGEALRQVGEKYQTETESVFAEMRSGKYNKLYLASAGLDLGIFHEITVSFSLLHPELLLPLCHEKKLLLLAGKDHTDALIRAFDADRIDLASFLDDIGNELRRMILETLAGEGELTASDIARLTGIPVTTVIRHLEALCDHYLLRVSRRKGLQIFYTVNREYLAKAHKKTTAYLQTLSGETHAERNQR